jgi:hypothetical protein
MFVDIVLVSWKCSLNGYAFLSKNNIFIIKWVQYKWKKQLVDNPSVFWSMRTLVKKFASHIVIFDKSNSPNFVFDFNYNNTSSAWN